MYKRFGWAVLVVILLLAGLPAAAQEVEVVGGTEEQLRELLSAFLAPYYLGIPGSETRVLVGELPATGDAPVEVPVPEDAVILGSVVRDAMPNLQIYYTTPQSVDAALAFYETALTEPDWRPLAASAGAGGFTQADVVGTTYCAGEGEGALSILARELEGGETGVTLVYVSPNGSYPPCDQPDPLTTADNVLPRITPPNDARQSSSTGGGGGNQWNSTTTLETSLGVTELAAHYAAQLEEAGWTLTGEDAADTVTTSIWSFTADGAEWTGVLVITESGEDQRVAFLQVAQAN